ncbi:hypothetical protein FUA23_03795 [Neolewinella aurantiaca]|uniref:BioF2-like acetyltransferase domain-containing protein n=1 Tax=Neolewinella aurantiaca TaxID=2602767 RepID=A0A5C7FIF3_9BACT|nr:hypothetical protein [Neolewinella aurantiaca]TXF90933.1 hypothetical protein FUA23_03795 [Neolewinella aurantiaca]
MDIRFVKQEDIDKQLYNSCVHFATNGSVYGYDWFLNATAKEWDVLVEVENDSWVSVMPLPYDKNWLGRLQLRQPDLVPELAVYSVKALSPKRIQSFWDAIPDKFRGGGLTVEPASVPADQGRFEVEAAAGSALLLNQPYEEIIGDFSPAYHEGLIRAEAAELRPQPSFKPEKLAAFWKEVNGSTATNEWAFHAMQRLMYQVLHRSWGGSHVMAGKDGEPLAMTFLVYSHGRIFPMFTAQSKKGKTVGALTSLWDNLLRTHAGKGLKLKKEEVVF